MRRTVSRKMGAGALVVGVAMAVLVLAPITVSVPTKPRELVVLMVGLAAMLAGFFFLLRRELRPLRDLTREMGRVDPLAPGRRADITVLAVVDEPWEFHDSTGDRLSTERRLVPQHVVRNGVVIECTSRLLRDVR